MVENQNYTPNEVAALIEDLRSEFRVVSEVVVPMREDMAEVKERLSRVEDDLRSIKDVLRIELPSMRSRLSDLEAKQ